MEEILPPNVTLRDPGDFTALRKNIFDGAKDALAKSFPVSFGRYRMEVRDVDYDGPESFDLGEQKQAILGDKFLTRKLRGTVNLIENASNRVVDSKKMSLMRVPYLTERGTFIHGGNEYATINQARLLPGVYTRRQANGELETQFNPKPGSGRAFRVGLEPATAQYHLRVGQSNLHLYSLLHDLGVPDADIAKDWGPEILEQNRKKYDARVFEKAFQRLVHPRDQPNFAERVDRARAIHEALDKVQVHEGVLRQNLPNFYDQTKSASWLAAYDQLEDLKENEKRAAEMMPFKPDLTADEVVDDVGHWFDKEAAAPQYVRINILGNGQRRLLHHFLRADKWGAPAGMIEEGETPEQAAVRELLERTGYSGDATKLRLGSQDADFHNFDVNFADLKQKAKPGELGGYETEVRWNDDPLLKGASFTPDLKADDMRAEINSIVGKVGPRISSMKQWPSTWLTPGNPLGWLQWFQKYSGGARGDEDAHHIMRWKRFKALQVPKFTAAPTARRAFTLRNWAIDPEKLVAPDQLGKLKSDMTAYRAKATDRWMEQKSASLEDPEVLDFMVKESAHQIKEAMVKEAKLYPDKLLRLFRRKGLDQKGNLPLHEDGSVLTSDEFDELWEGSYTPEQTKVCTPTWDEPSHKKIARPKTYYVDLDGTLAKRYKGDFDPEVIGEPTDLVDHFKAKMDDGHKVVIFTARADKPANIPPIKAWAKKHGLGDIEVTNEKKPEADFIVDDKAIAIKPDTGESFHRKLASAGFNPKDYALISPEELDNYKRLKGGDVPADTTIPGMAIITRQQLAELNSLMPKSAAVKCPACGAVPGKYKIHGDAIQCGECEKTSDMEKWEPQAKEVSLDELMTAAGSEKSAAAKPWARLKRMREETYDACPHCQYEFPEKGYPRMKNREEHEEGAPGIYECPKCKEEILEREMDDEEINKLSPWFKSMMLESREKRRNWRKEARLSYDHNTVEENRVAARKVTVAPKSAAQAEAGNYPKGKFWWNGLQIALENPKGSVRRDWKHDPPNWTTDMVADYGYFLLTISEADEDHLDCFVGPWLDSGVVYVVNQHKNDGTFDEHKVMVGYTTEKEARDGYLAHYEKGWKGLKSIAPLTVEQFKKWAKGGNTKNPLKELSKP